jgi:hypothetical protein
MEMLFRRGSRRFASIRLSLGVKLVMAANFLVLPGPENTSQDATATSSIVRVRKGDM